MSSFLLSVSAEDQTNLNSHKEPSQLREGGQREKEGDTEGERDRRGKRQERETEAGRKYLPIKKASLGNQQAIYQMMARGQKCSQELLFHSRGWSG